MNISTASLMRRCFLLLGLSPSLLAGVFAQTTFSATADANPLASLRNITQTAQLLEVNPRFVYGGSHVLYLEYVADAASNYRLMLADRNGFAVEPLTTTGVLDYAVDETDGDVLIITSGTSTEEEMDVDYLQRPTQWQLWKLSLKTRSLTPLSDMQTRPLTEGYALLGVSGLPEYDRNVMTCIGPNDVNTIHVKLVAGAEPLQLKFFHSRAGGAVRQVFRSTAYATQMHFPWFPDVAWIDENIFITQAFNREGQQDFPQSTGKFSIVKVNLNDAVVETMFVDGSIKPFPRFSLDDSRTWLYFQTETADGISELRRLNLADGKAEIVYRTAQEIGEARPSPDGASVVLSLNFDIVRLDVEMNKIQRLAGY